MIGKLQETNREVKWSTLLLACILIIFCIFQWWFYRESIQRQKQNYIDVIGGITAKVVALDPDYEEEIIYMAVADINAQDVQDGRELLREYGITGTLEDALFPNLKTDPAPVAAALLLSCLLLLLNYVQYSRVFLKIRRLTKAAEHFLSEDFICPIEENAEGDMAKLSSAFSKARRVIQNQMEQGFRERQQVVELLQNVSHQFKTRLATMLLYNDILMNRRLTEQQRTQFLRDNAAQLDSMNSMIQRVLKLARLDAHVVEYEKKPCSMASLLGEVMEGLHGLAAEGEVSISLLSREDFVLDMDRFWMCEAFQNIVKNCIEHTPKGGSVTVEIVLMPVAYRVIVRDTGEGIGQADLANIFQRFYHSRGSRKKDSVGIGLSIAKSVVEAHDGFIDAMSAKGEGTSFIVSFMNTEKKT